MAGAAVSAGGQWTAAVDAGAAAERVGPDDSDIRRRNGHGQCGTILPAQTKLDTSFTLLRSSLCLHELLFHFLTIVTHGPCWGLHTQREACSAVSHTEPILSLSFSQPLAGVHAAWTPPTLNKTSHLTILLPLPSTHCSHDCASPALRSTRFSSSPTATAAHCSRSRVRASSPSCRPRPARTAWCWCWTGWIGGT